MRNFGEIYQTIRRQVPEDITYSTSGIYHERSYALLEAAVSASQCNDEEMIGVVKHLLPRCLGFRNHKPRVRMSNSVLLTDELR
jgi:hypothetical protein